MKRAAALGLAVCGLGLAMGCRTPAPGDRLGVAELQPARLLAGLAERASEIRALRGRARVEILAPDLKVRRPQRLAVARPGRLRVEVLGLFGQVAALLVANEGVYQLYEPGQAQLQEGLVSASLLWRVARVDLEPGEAVDLLLGSPLPGPGLRLGEAHAREDGGVAFDRRDELGAVRERYVFDAEGRLREMERLDAGNVRLWKARFDDYRKVSQDAGPEQSFAFELRLDFPRVGGRATLDFQQVALAAQLPDELFRLDISGSRPAAGKARAH